MLDYMRSLPREVTFKEEVQSYQFWKTVRTEFLCATLYVLISGGASLDLRSLPPRGLDEPSMTLIELKTGLVLACVICALMFISAGHFSSQKGSVCSRGIYETCHLNPAVTFSLLLVRELSILRFVSYLTSQIIGSLLACSILHGLTFYDQSGRVGLASLEARDGLPPSNLFGFEFIATFLITLTYLKATDNNCNDRRSCHHQPVTGVGGGLTSDSSGHRLIESNGFASPANISANISDTTNFDSERSHRFVYVGLATLAAHLFSVSYALRNNAKALAV